MDIVNKYGKLIQGAYIIIIAAIGDYSCKRFDHHSTTNFQ